MAGEEGGEECAREEEEGAGADPAGDGPGVAADGR